MTGGQIFELWQMVIASVGTMLCLAVLFYGAHKLY